MPLVTRYGEAAASVDFFDDFPLNGLLAYALDHRPLTHAASFDAVAVKKLLTLRVASAPRASANDFDCADSCEFQLGLLKGR